MAQDKTRAVKNVPFSGYYNRPPQGDDLECIGAGPLPARTAVGVSHVTRGALIEMDFVVRTRD